VCERCNEGWIVFGKGFGLLGEERDLARSSKAPIVFVGYYRPLSLQLYYFISVRSFCFLLSDKRLDLLKGKCCHLGHLFMNHP
jgi:hypothetical protein